MIKTVLAYLKNSLVAAKNSSPRSKKAPDASRDPSGAEEVLKKMTEVVNALSDLNRNLSELNRNTGHLSYVSLTKFRIEQNDTLDRLVKNHPNPLARYGKKIFSQTDEDGITLEIIKRIGISKGSFAEFGVGNGMENNTLILLSLGWRGFWVGGEDLSFETSELSRLNFSKDWITRENIIDIFKSGIDDMKIKDLDVLSLDLDGNDYYFHKDLLEFGARPKLFIVEINATMPPPVEFTIEYDKDFIWKGSDYCGASVQALSNLFEKFDYTLICCNTISGANAFFIRNEFTHLFPDVPREITKIYSGNNWRGQYGHQYSLETIKRIISD
jgi:hypothetical protein